MAGDFMLMLWANFCVLAIQAIEAMNC